MCFINFLCIYVYVYTLWKEERARYEIPDIDFFVLVGTLKRSFLDFINSFQRRNEKLPFTKNCYKLENNKVTSYRLYRTYIIGDIYYL